MLATASYAGKPVPFGATATLPGEGRDGVQYSSIVGDDGQVYLSGVKEGGSRVKISWGRDADEQCEGTLTLSPDDAGARIRMAQLLCR